MADNTVTIEQLPPTVSLDGTELVPVAVPNGLGGYTTQRTSTGSIAAVGVDAEFVLVSSNPLLPEARILAGASGQVTINDGGAAENVTIGLAASGVAAGTYGDTTHVAQVTIDSTGRVTSAQNISVSAGGTVTSVALTAPPQFDVSGTPVTGAGTLGLTWANQSENQVFAGPSSGGAGTPAFRAIVGSDLPASGVTAGTYGDGTHVAQVAVDSTGRITSAAQVAITHVGDVTSVGLSLPSDFTISGSPVTSSGTLTGAWTTTPTGTGAMVRAVSPALTGTPTAPTASLGDNTTKIATTAFVLANGSAAVAATRSALAGVSTSKSVVWLEEANREGMFQWNSANLSTQVSADTQQGVYVAPAIDPTGASGAWVRQYNGGLSQYWFGAVGDGATDDTAALQGCINLAAYLQDFTTNTPLSGLIIQWTPGRHKITSTLTINTSLAADLGAATIYVPGATLKSGIAVGSTSSGTFVRRLKLRLPQIVNTDKPSTGWAGVSDAVGLTISNVTDSKLEIPFVFGFGTNILYTAFGGGCSYNAVNLGYIYDGFINLLIQPGDALSAFANETSWYDGHFSYPSAEGSRVSGTRDICILNSVGGSTTNLPNHHVFYRPVVEDSTAEYNIYIEGRDNAFVEGRYEGPSTIAIYSATDQETETNRFIGGMNLENAVFSYIFGGTATETKYNGLTDPFRSVYESVSGGTFPNIVIGNSSGNADIRGYDGPGSQNLLTKDQTDTGWVYELSSSHLDGKIRTAAGFSVRMDFANGRYCWGNAGAVVASLSYNSAFGIGTGGSIGPNTDNTYSSGGGVSNRWSDVWAVKAHFFPPASVTPANNGEMTFQLTSNTSLAIKVKGSDGTVRTGTITLS